MYSENEWQDFYRNYRESLSRQNENDAILLDQRRRNAQASIMSGANKAGMLYSNMTGRSKLQYDTNTYTPALTKLNTTYQTGLDTLRNNILKYQNSISDIQDAINHLNSMQ